MPIDPQTGEKLPYPGDPGYQDEMAAGAPPEGAPPSPEGAPEEALTPLPSQVESSPASVIDQALSQEGATGTSILAALESSGFTISLGGPAGEAAPPMPTEEAGGPMPPGGNQGPGGGMPMIMIAVREAMEKDKAKKAKGKAEQEGKEEKKESK